MKMFPPGALLGALILVAPDIHAQTADEIIVDSAEASHVFNIEIADTPETIETGLMDREALDENAGMLFDFGEARDAAMWMKGTPLPLDMLFIDAGGRVVAIARNTVPFSERQIRAGTPIRAVLELNAGRSRALGIEPGAMVRHAVFDTGTDSQPEEVDEAGDE